MTNTIKNTATPMKERLKGFGQIAIAGTVTLILVSGCVEKTQQNDPLNKSSSLFFPVQKNQTDECMYELLSDKLIIDDNGCLRANNYLLVWPYDFSISTEEGVIQVIDDAGKPVAHVGNKYNISGGGGEMSNELISKYSAQLPSDRCPGPYFIVCKYGIEVI